MLNVNGQLMKKESFQFCLECSGIVVISNKHDVHFLRSCLNLCKLENSVNTDCWGVGYFTVQTTFLMPNERHQSTEGKAKLLGLCHCCWIIIIISIIIIAVNQYFDNTHSNRKLHDDGRQFFSIQCFQHAATCYNLTS